MFQKTVCAGVITLALCATASAQDDLAVDAIRMGSASTEAAAEIQRQIEQIDDQIAEMTLQVLTLHAEQEFQHVFNEQQRVFLISQNNEIRSLEGLNQRLDEMETGFSSVLPDLLDILAAHIAADPAASQHARFYEAELAEISGMIDSDSVADAAIYARLVNLLLSIHSRGHRLPLELPEMSDQPSVSLSVGRVADLQILGDRDVAIKFSGSGLTHRARRREVQIRQPDLQNGFVPANSHASGGVILPLPGARDAGTGLPHQERAHDLLRGRQTSPSTAATDRNPIPFVPSTVIDNSATAFDGLSIEPLSESGLIDRLEATAIAQRIEGESRLEAFQARLAAMTALRDDVAEALVELEAEAEQQTEQFNANQARFDQLSGEFPPRRDRLAPILITIQEADQSMMRALRSTPVSHQHPHREALLPIASDRQAYPALHQLEWRFRLMISDIQRHGEIVRYRAQVRLNEDVRNAQLVRIGALTAFTRIEGRFYRLAPSDDYSTAIPDLEPVEDLYQAMYARYWEAEPSEIALLYIPRPRSVVFRVLPLLER